MIYPCEECLVDPICLDTCDKFIWYLDALVKCPIPDELISTDVRGRRVRKTAILYCHTQINLHTNIRKAIIKLKRRVEDEQNSNHRLSA